MTGKKLEPEKQETFAEAEKAMEDWMMSHSREIIRERTEFLTKLNKKRCSYGEGTTLPISLTPVFLKDSTVRLIARVAETLDKALDKVIDAYPNDARVRSYFPYLDIPEEWVAWNPGYKKPTVINRHDALFNGEELQFIEFNTDMPGGRGWIGVYEELFSKQSYCGDLIGKYVNPKRPHVLEEFLGSLLNCYKEFGGKEKNPRIGITSFKSYLVGSDAEIVRDFMIEKGYEANFLDPRELEYKKGGLYSNNIKFDLVNLAIRFVFYKRYPRELKDFLGAIRDGAVCAVNPFRAIIGAHKEIMALMTNEENHDLFSAKEAETIKKHVPWTRKLDETITLSPEGTDISLHQYLLAHKDTMVIKPTGGAGGQDVFVGSNTEVSKWESVVENCMGCSWWIAQKAFEVPEYDFMTLEDGKVIQEKRNLNLNPFVFNGKYVGTLGRASRSKVVNVSSGGGGLIPVFPLRPGVE
ncbi:hypothetical protein HOF92_12645 [bacterium]|jgi:hypothetical protein|nr:hypothetical protein [bacterium]